LLKTRRKRFINVTATHYEQLLPDFVKVNDKWQGRKGKHHEKPQASTQTGRDVNGLCVPYSSDHDITTLLTDIIWRKLIMISKEKKPAWPSIATPAHASESHTNRSKIMRRHRKYFFFPETSSY